MFVYCQYKKLYFFVLNVLTIQYIGAIMYSENRGTEVNKMARKKKNGNKDKALQAIVLITAILNLVKAVIDLIIRLTS